MLEIPKQVRDDTDPSMFEFHKTYFLGLDFGTSYIKAVELAVKDGAAQLVNYGQVEMNFTEGRNTFQLSSTEGKSEEYLRLLLGTLQPKAASACVAMPGFSGLITLIELPKMKPEELQQAIRFEAPKYIPSALEDVSLSWDVVSDAGSKAPETPEGEASGKVEVLLVAALNKEVEKFEQYVKSAGLKLDLLELEIFSMVRSLFGDDPGTFLVIDIGSRATNLVLVENGTIRVNRNLNFGGNEITSTVSESMGITWERAEALKQSGKDFLNIPEGAIIFPTLDLIVNETQRILKSFGDKKPENGVEAVILSGGSAKMQGLERYLGKAFTVPVRVGNPWKHILFDERLRPAVEELGTSYSVALGLALAGVKRSQESK